MCCNGSGKDFIDSSPIARLEAKGSWIPTFGFDPAVVVQKELASRFSPSPAISESLLDDACATLGPSDLCQVARDCQTLTRAEAEMGSREGGDGPSD
jgi:hypothetical protein